jgi:hypothetical protein
VKQKQIEVAPAIMKAFLSGLVLNFGADFHELEITKKAPFQIESEEQT